MMYRRIALLGCLLALLCLFAPRSAMSGSGREVVKYARFQAGDTIAYGVVQGNRIRQLAGPFGAWRPTDKSYALSEVELLAPSKPSQVFAMAGNYKSHLGGETTTTIITTVSRVVTDGKTNQTTTESKTEFDVRKPGVVPDKFKIPQPFFKSPSCLLPHGGKIVLPRDAGVVHYEAEMVIVIGKKAKNVNKSEALDYVLGVTCGNDVSAREWQKGDVQWWRAKGSDTFGPCGPYVVSGLNYDKLEMTLRLNGEVKQKENTSQLIHDVPSMVSFLSRHVTLQPGDLIFTGTPGQTSELKPGDKVDVELEGVGVLSNTVVAEK